MPQYQGIWTLQQQAQALTNQQWVTDPYYKNTTLHLQADGTGSGSQNHNFLDSSTNNFYVGTANPRYASQSTFTPFTLPEGHWSNYFDGTDDFLTSSTALFNYTIANASTQTATIEAFVYITALQSAPTNIWENPCIAGKGDVYMNFGVNASGNLFMYHISGGTARNTISSSTVSLNTWNHVAAVISGGTITLYINGVASGSGTWFGIDAAGQDSTSYFGETPDTDSKSWLGYISNLRVSTTARAITVPTSPYSNDGNTAFLTFQSNRFVDNSSNAYAIAASGTPSVQAFSPFTPVRQWTPEVVGGSGYFNHSHNTADFESLYVPYNPNLQLGTADFTVNFWLYATPGAFPIPFIFGGVNPGEGPGGNGALNLRILSNLAFRLNLTGVSGLGSNTAANTIFHNTWNFIEVSRVGTTLYLNVNGVNVQTITSFTTDLNQTAPISLACTYNNYFPYYMSNFHFQKGVGTATPSTIPTAPPTLTAYTQLLLKDTNAGIYDSTMKTSVDIIGQSQIAIIPSKNGNGSIKFDGTGDNLLLPYNPGHDLPGDFTIEFWLWWGSASNGAMVLNKGGGSGIAYASYEIYTDTTTGNIRFAGSTTNSSYDVGGESSAGDMGVIRPSVWNHIAVTRSGTTFRGFVNGIRGFLQTGVTAKLYNSSPRGLAIGSNFETTWGTTTPTNSLNGYIDDLRITAGVARYIADFTPPQQALPRQ